MQLKNKAALHLFQAKKNEPSINRLHLSLQVLKKGSTLN